MSSEQGLPIDLVADSLAHVVTMCFPKTSSPGYPLAVNLAQGAAKYSAVAMSGKLVHLMAFSNTPDQIARARSILTFASNWKGFQVFARGNMLQRASQAGDIMRCYLEASASNDWRAHCHDVINDPYSEFPRAFAMAVTISVSVEKPAPSEAKFVDRYVFPCTLLKPYFKFKTDHPSSPEDQIQAAAVKQGCDWCPRFDAAHYRKTGSQAQVQP